MVYGTQNAKTPESCTLGAATLQGDAAKTEDRLTLAAMDLSAVAARSAPEPFGKDAEVVFNAAWDSLLKVLPAISVDHLKELLKNE